MCACIYFCLSKDNNKCVLPGTIQVYLRSFSKEIDVLFSGSFDRCSCMCVCVCTLLDGVALREKLEDVCCRYKRKVIPLRARDKHNGSNKSGQRSPLMASLETSSSRSSSPPPPPLPLHELILSQTSNSHSTLTLNLFSPTRFEN